jgi:hypothetical protein
MRRPIAAWLVALAGVEVWLIAALVVEAPHRPAPIRRTPPFIVDPARVAFEHDGIATRGYALYLQREDGTAVRLDLGLLHPDEHGLLSAPLPELPVGLYTLEIVAYNAAGESPRARSEPSRFIVTAPHRRDRPHSRGTTQAGR